jgi:LacI family transcriptional regulator
LRQTGLPADESLVENVPEFGFEGGYGGFSRLVHRCPEVTGVLCINDTMALGVMAAAEALGRKCPQDLSVIGFGDFPEGRHWRPRLTTVTLSENRVAEQAVRVVLQQQERPQRQTVLIPEELLVRESTGPAPLRGSGPREKP